MKGKVKMLIKANNYSITPRRVIAGTKGSYGIETLEFAFSAEWNGLTKRVTFYPVDGNPVSVLYEDEPINIPAEVTASAGVAQFTLSGIRDDAVLISVTGYLDVFDSNDPVGDPAVQPTPSDVSRVISLMNEAVSCADSVREDADNGVFNGQDGTDGFSPVVTVTNISGGHRVGITDATHPGGQFFDVLDGVGGGGSGIEIVDLTSNSAYHKGKISILPEYDNIRSGVDFDNTDYRARLDFENGKIVIEYYYPGGHWTTVKEITNGFVFSDDTCGESFHRPGLAWVFNGTCDYSPVVVDNMDYDYWVYYGTESEIPYKCVVEGNNIFSLIYQWMPNGD